MNRNRVTNGETSPPPPDTNITNAFSSQFEEIERQERSLQQPAPPLQPHHHHYVFPSAPQHRQQAPAPPPAAHHHHQQAFPAASAPSTVPPTAPTARGDARFAAAPSLQVPLVARQSAASARSIDAERSGEPRFVPRVTTIIPPSDDRPGVGLVQLPRQGPDVPVPSASPLRRPHNWTAFMDDEAVALLGMQSVDDVLGWFMRRYHQLSDTEAIRAHLTELVVRFHGGE